MSNLEKRNNTNLPYGNLSLDQFEREMREWIYESPLKSIFQEIEQLFEQASPFPNIFFEDFQTETQYIIKAHLPNIKKDQIFIDLYYQYLTISIEHNETMKQKNHDGTFINSFSSMGKIAKTFYLPSEVRDQELSINHELDILTITVPIK
ncbi:Hsp20 family protein [Bacillus carboniphilus]|uniref:Hsp20 family protein n=1 Tax=Bacillus carboniphilus TaxID=86663 RepID=A0ABY9JZ23_9BACI|nr:Hsp20 family protein [Bacillus carboniphilus]WLR43695.1 Hsp20 family protein [Bacillus carboniphilus]